MSYIMDWASPDEKDTEESIYIILKRIFENLIEEMTEISIKKVENYEVNFTLLYYEKGEDMKYICIPQDIKKEKLTEYLFTTISMYE